MNTSIGQSAPSSLSTMEIDEGKEKQVEEIEPRIVITDDLSASIGMCLSHCTRTGTRG